MIYLKMIVAFSFSIILIKCLIIFAHKVNLVDKPNVRSAHKKAIPTSAGVGFTFSFLFVFLIFEYDLFINNLLLFIAIGLIFVVGILDDHKNTTPKVKFYVIFISVIILYFQNIFIVNQ